MMQSFPLATLDERIFAVSRRVSRPHQERNETGTVMEDSRGVVSVPAARASVAARRKRLLVFAYACEPGRGSEPGAGWGLVRALHALKYNPSGYSLCRGVLCKA